MTASTPEERWEEREKALLESIPPRLPWVLLCHQSGGQCGTCWTVNRPGQWRPAIRDLMKHERACTVLPRVGLTH